MGISFSESELLEEKADMTGLFAFLRSSVSEKVNIRKVKIPISISKIIRLRLGDALLFVVYHNERHVQQALNVLNNPNFPK